MQARNPNAGRQAAEPRRREADLALQRPREIGRMRAQAHTEQKEGGGGGGGGGGEGEAHGQGAPTLVSMSSILARFIRARAMKLRHCATSCKTGAASSQGMQLAPRARPSNLCGSVKLERENSLSDKPCHASWLIPPPPPPPPSPPRPRPRPRPVLL